MVVIAGKPGKLKRQSDPCHGYGLKPDLRDDAVFNTLNTKKKTYWYKNSGKESLMCRREEVDRM